jgi:hypothetical protein
VRAIGERIGRRVAAHAVEVPGKGDVSVTCSVGVALFPFDTERPGELTWEETVVLADCALYEAKGRGRDQACWLRPGPAGASPREVLAAARENLGDAIRDGTLAVQGRSSPAAVDAVDSVTMPPLLRSAI